MPVSKKKVNKPILFAFPSYAYMVQPLLRTENFTVGEFELSRFPNGEMHMELHTSVKKNRCFVLGTITPPESNLIAYLLLCHTLKKEKALEITAVLPYLAYSRHDKNEWQKSYGLAFIGQLFASAGITDIVTIDIHSLQAKTLFPMALFSLSPAKIFVAAIKKIAKQDTTIMAPDKGAINRCKIFAKQLGVRHNIAYLEKTRTKQGIIHSALHGEIGKQVFIVDDILDTGRTLISCCERLNKIGVKEIYIIVTHGCFTGNKWEQLWKLGVKRIYCTDTVPLPSYVINSNIIVVSVIPLLINTLNNSKLKGH